jgi:predicted helicase
LRGNARTSGELRRKEKDNIFGQGTRTPVAISILIKNPHATEQGKIYLHDIGDYLSQQDKLTKISEFKSLNGISQANGWRTITPDPHHDWVSQRDDSFSEFISLGDKKDKDSVTVFENYSRGAETGRDAWCYNCSKNQLTKNILNMIDFYNQEVNRYKAECNGIIKTNWPNLDNFVSNDPAKISWTSSLKTDAQKHLEHSFFKENMTNGLYRPYSKQWTYFGNQFTHRVGQIPRIYPTGILENRMIYLSGSGNSGKEFSALISDIIPDLNMQHSGGQGFPLKLYEEIQHTSTEGVNLQGDMFSSLQSNKAATNDDEYTIKDGITDAGLAHFQSAYPTETITKEDVFYYIYGLLHSEDYKSRYADNLSKELPRIPCVNKAADFWAFSKAGRDLAELHINYETVTPYPVTIDCGANDFDNLSDADFYVTQMKFIKKGEKSTVVYNHRITLTNIPLEAYDYVVNGKPALEWVMERQAVTTHKDSGIKNDANAWAIETVGNARYPLELFQRVITVSLETMKIINALPKLDIAKN